MDPLKRFRKLKEDHERAVRDRDRAEGALGQVREEAKKKFGVSTEKGLRELADRLREEVAEAMVAAETALEEYEKEYGERLR